MTKSLFHETKRTYKRPFCKPKRVEVTVSAQIIRFKHLPFLGALRRVQKMTVEECCGIIWMLQLTVKDGFRPERFALADAILFGADLMGRFSIRGEIVTQERMLPFENGMFALRMAFRATQQESGFLDRVHFHLKDPTLSNIRYLAFPPSVTRHQVENAGFNSHLTGEQLSPKRGHGK